MHPDGGCASLCSRLDSHFALHVWAPVCLPPQRLENSQLGLEATENDVYLVSGLSQGLKLVHLRESEI